MHGKSTDQPIYKSTKRQVIDAGIDFLGGVNGGVAAVYIGQPLDTVKVKMQTFPNLYKNSFDCFKTTFARDGIARGLYAGTLPSLMAQVAENSVTFLGYGLCQKLVASVTNKQVSNLSVMDNASSGALAAFFSSFTLCPTELIKCKLQAMKEVTAQSGAGSVSKAHIGPFALTKEILREEGLRGMYKGLTPTIAREMPGYFIFFGGYELCKSALTKGKREMNAFETVACGGLAGMLSWTAIFPLDVIKSRIQIRKADSTNQSKSAITILKNVIKEEGFMVLYKGLGPTVIRSIPVSGMLFLAYETTKKYFGMAADWCGID